MTFVLTAAAHLNDAALLFWVQRNHGLVKR